MKYRISFSVMLLMVCLVCTAMLFVYENEIPPTIIVFDVLLLMFGYILSAILLVLPKSKEPVNKIHHFYLGYSKDGLYQYKRTDKGNLVKSRTIIHGNDHKITIFGTNDIDLYLDKINELKQERVNNIKSKF